MGDSTGKRFREAKKRQQREQKAQRKQMRKDGRLWNDTSGLFAPGEVSRPIVNLNQPSTREPKMPPIPEGAEKTV